ncbi:nuclear transport factor 2 family protein [Streptomyces sp. PU-14G]|uniref:nuclear transport factor 2 family protein n=1 Tax=Streptomyces sp. PU-14G TaxID=2800808 RepID=UPI0034DEF049
MAATPRSTVSRDLTTFGSRWAGAELRGDIAALEALLTDDFVAVGPRGFLLDKRRWLARYETGALVHDLFTWHTEHLRRHGDGAVLLGVQSQQSVYEGRDVDGHFRATHHLTTAASAGTSATAATARPTWRLAALHLSPIEGTPPESLAGLTAQGGRSQAQAAGSTRRGVSER